MSYTDHSFTLHSFLQYFIFRDDVERENAKLLKELDRVQAEHRIDMQQQANANNMLIKEYKKQNLLLQNAVVVSKTKGIKRGVVQHSNDEEMNNGGDEVSSKDRVKKSRMIRNNKNDDVSDVESLMSSPSFGNGKRKRGKRGRGRRTAKSAYRLSPSPANSHNNGDKDGYFNRQERISIKRSTSTDKDYYYVSEDIENCDPSLVLSSISSHENSISSSSTKLGETKGKKPLRNERLVKQNKNMKKPIKKEVSFSESDESLLGQNRSLRRSLRERSNSKGIMAPPSNKKMENPTLSPLIEGEGAITVTTTDTLLPQKPFITPYSKKKKLFTNTPINEVM